MSRSDFIETFLTESILLEMPSGLGNFNTFDEVCYYILEKKKEYSSIQIKADLYKIIGPQLEYYWYENAELFLEQF